MLGWEQCSELAEQAAQQGKFSDAEAMWMAALEHIDHGDLFNERLITTLAKLAEVSWNQHKYDLAETYYKRCLDHAEMAYGADHTEVAKALARLSGAYYNQAKYAEAEPICLRLMQICQSKLGPDHDQVGLVTASLATIYHAQRKYDSAETLYKRAIAIRTKALGGGHPEVVSLLAKYANLLSATHREDEAQYYRDVVKKFFSGEWSTPKHSPTPEAKPGA